MGINCRVWYWTATEAAAWPSAVPEFSNEYETITGNAVHVVRVLRSLSA